MSRRLAVGLLLTLALAACGDPSPSPSARASVDGASGGSSDPVEPSNSPAANPGRPYDAEAILTAMRDSRRPGGVPDAMQTEAIADAVSRQLWTWDGQPWLLLSIGGACGPSSCSLDVAGSRGDTAGADLYSFSVDSTSGELAVAITDLHAYPSSLDARLDEAAQAAVGGQLGRLAYIGARWQPPPGAGHYWLAYRSGGEEGAPGLDLLLDLDSGAVIETRPV